MPRDRLRELVRELHEELSGPKVTDAETRDMLGAVRQDIETALASEIPPADQSTSGRVRQVLERYEGENPELVSLLNRILEALGHVGI